MFKLKIKIKTEICGLNPDPVPVATSRGFPVGRIERSMLRPKSAGSAGVDLA